jgi:murein L,D-transpeptidase YafK
MRKKVKNLGALAEIFALVLLVCLFATSAKKPEPPRSEAPRVKQARVNNEQEIKELFAKAGIDYPPRKLFIRIFKLERSVEIWAMDDDSGQFKLIDERLACALSGNLGPKRRQGDHQVPEGFYALSDFNPYSKFHLSLRVNYPNKADLALCAGNDPGGDIFIHGSCVSDGCVAIRDAPIEQLYLLASDAKANGQKTIPVHIFPCRMDKSYCSSVMGFFSIDDEGLKKFWNSLKPGYDFFEQNHLLPEIKISSDGYCIAE